MKLIKLMKNAGSNAAKSKTKTKNNRSNISKTKTKHNRSNISKGVIPLIVDMIQDLVKNGISQEEFKLAKDNIKGSFLLSSEDNETFASYNGDQLLLYPDKTDYISYSKNYETYYNDITLSQVNDIIKKYFIRSNMNVCIVGTNLPNEKTIRNTFDTIL